MPDDHILPTDPEHRGRSIDRLIVEGNLRVGDHTVVAGDGNIGVRLYEQHRADFIATQPDSAEIARRTILAIAERYQFAIGIRDARHYLGTPRLVAVPEPPLQPGYDPGWAYRQAGTPPWHGGA